LPQNKWYVDEVPIVWTITHDVLRTVAKSKPLSAVVSHKFPSLDDSAGRDRAGTMLELIALIARTCASAFICKGRGDEMYICVYVSNKIR
jgi:hypothetical protein